MRGILYPFMNKQVGYILWLIIYFLVFLGLVLLFSQLVTALVTGSETWKGLGIWLVSDGVATLSISLILLLLATFRITRLVVYDKMTLPVRQIIDSAATAGNGFFLVLKDLVSCPWCVSMWAALAVLFLLLLGSFGFVLLGILALSGAASLIQIFSNLIGWSAERKKQKVQKK